MTTFNIKIKFNFENVFLITFLFEIVLRFENVIRSYSYTYKKIIKILKKYKILIKLLMYSNDNYNGHEKLEFIFFQKQIIKWFMFTLLF